LARQSAPIARQEPDAAKAQSQELREDFPSFDVARLERIQQMILSRSVDAQKLLDDGQILQGEITAKLDACGSQYSQAFDKFVGVLALAEAEEGNQAAFENLILGLIVAAGVAVAIKGVAAAAAVKATTAAISSMVPTTIRTIAGATATKAVGGEIVEQTVAGPIEQVGQTGLVASAYANFHPAIQRSADLSVVLELVSAMAELGQEMPRLGELGMIVSATIGQVHHCLATGEGHSGRSAADISRHQELIFGVQPQIELFDSAFEKATKAIQATSAAVGTEPVPEVAALEQDLWINWIATLTDDQSNQLDIDVIEDHLVAIGILGPEGRLGVSFGVYTSKADELRAIRAAAIEAGLICVDLPAT
jgi:hypothetical protein